MQDSRQLTPELHAILVSEILALRRDQEEKMSQIESLETELHDLVKEHEKWAATLESAAKESRSLKRQLALLEGGTSSALSELAGERDDALETNTVIERHVKVAQETTQKLEEDEDPVYQLHGGEGKQKGESNARIAEGRLKTVFGEEDSIRRPHRISSLFAGFDAVSSDEDDVSADADMSDDNHWTDISAPKLPTSANTASNRTSLASTLAPKLQVLPQSAPNKSAVGRLARPLSIPARDNARRHSTSASVPSDRIGLVESPNEPHSVIDAVAQTMVGEWMFKYVRSSKSFGLPGSNSVEKESANGVRHKRWVWLAPYERAVMWSSKQPTSGSALMGNKGRKCKLLLCWATQF